MFRSGRGHASFPAIIVIYPRRVFNQLYPVLAVDVLLMEHCECRGDVHYYWPLSINVNHTSCYEDVPAYSILDRSLTAMQEVGA